MSTSPPGSRNIVWHQTSVTRARREAANKHRGAVIWFTGLSGAGKSTLAHATEELLHQAGCRTYVLDGDNIRHGLCSDLDFSTESREENIRRVGEVAKLFLDAGVIVLTAFISPFRADRDRARSMVPASDFIEIYCSTSVEVCEQRDVKGLYKKARDGKIADFTGISSAYEPPLNPDLEIDTGQEPIESCVQRVVSLLRFRGIVT